jgi:hypothetical protein
MGTTSNSDSAKRLLDGWLRSHELKSKHNVKPNQTHDSATTPLQQSKNLQGRGDEIYETQVRSQVEEGDRGKIVAIDIETGDFEVDRKPEPKIKSTVIIPDVVASELAAASNPTISAILQREYVNLE